jgi:hypothetical protein
MSLDKLTCKEYQEMLPLAHNQVLDESSLVNLREHLAECPACRAIEKREGDLYWLANGNQSEQILANRVDAELMDDFARDPGSLSSEQRQTVEEYLTRFPDAAKGVDLLRKLPPTLDELMDGASLPSLERLEVSVTTPVTDIRPNTWRTWSVVAAAAVVVLIAVSQFAWRGDSSIAQIEAIFPAVTRSAQTLEFSAESSPALVQAKVYVDPEEGHFYAAEVYAAVNDSLVFHAGRLESFDELGFAEFQVELALGRYLLKLHDVIDNDTLTTEQPFRLVPQP